MLVVLIPHAIMKWSKRPGKGDRERKVRSICFAHLWLLPLQGCWVSWHWQVNINPQQGSPFWGYLQSLHGTAKLQSRAHHLLCVIHSRIKWSRKCVYWESREAWALSVLIFSWRSWTAPNVILYGGQCQIHDLQRRWFSFRNRDQAWSLKSFCIAEFY